MAETISRTQKSLRNTVFGMAEDITLILPTLYCAKTMRYLSKPLVNYCQTAIRTLTSIEESI